MIFSPRRMLVAGVIVKAAAASAAEQPHTTPGETFSAVSNDLAVLGVLRKFAEFFPKGAGLLLTVSTLVDLPGCREWHGTVKPEMSQKCSGRIPILSGDSLQMRIWGLSLVVPHKLGAADFSFRAKTVPGPRQVVHPL